MCKWKNQACISLELACAAISDGQLPQAILLLDDTCSLIAQAHLTEGSMTPTTSHGKSPPIPVFLRAMCDQSKPQLSKKRLKVLLALHDIRNIVVHQAAKRLKPTYQQCKFYLRETLAFASDYGVPRPKLIPSDLSEILPIQVLVEFGPKWDPRTRPAKHRKHVLRAIEKRGMLAGLIANANWPLVRCSLCKRLVPVGQLATPQDEFMTEDDEPVRVYCLYGCAQAYQATLRKLEKEGKLNGPLDPQLYLLQPLLQLIGSVPYWDFDGIHHGIKIA